MFKPIDIGVGRKKTALQREAQFLRAVQRIIRTVYPRMTTLRVRQARQDKKTKVVTLFCEHEHHTQRLTQDRELLRAVFRRESIDVRSVVVERF